MLGVVLLNANAGDRVQDERAIIAVRVGRRKDAVQEIEGAVPILGVEQGLQLRERIVRLFGKLRRLVVRGADDRRRRQGERDDRKPGEQADRTKEAGKRDHGENYWSSSMNLMGTDMWVLTACPPRRPGRNLHFMTAWMAFASNSCCVALSA